MAADPIQPVVQSLENTIATPQTSSGADPNAASSWKSGTATPGTVLPAIATLMQVLYAASGDMASLGKSISSALSEVTAVIRAIADQLPTLGAGAADPMQQLQQALQLAQTLSPTGPVVVLNSAGTLFGQIQQLLADTNQGAIDLYQLAQQLDLIGSQLAPK
ncbi:hypothetical protein M3I54_29755 [Paraburkholderia sp. CNPSo 3274]|uniref:hypothetical protein n=1 Tax=Paraburkholderia sp. CNPSo 3274 TaxID=2940932 RepID=UPI0020B70A46|nr:hypothetical protein [Paraburkholderia sp. CNPSo 3274]MCP3711113.1 hypothetical protein [Paraburkholderia sp. CNPSo 3274]